MLLSRYRATGADLPYGDPLPAHGVAMEGYFWRFTKPDTGDVVIALCGVNQGPEGPWATVGLAGHPGGFLRTTAQPAASASTFGLGAYAWTADAGRAVVGAELHGEAFPGEVFPGEVFHGVRDRLRVNLGPDASIDVRVTNPVPWPRRRFGGSSGFQAIPGLNQYWHPWLLGGRAEGRAVLGDREVDLSGAQVYCEKNWGREGFPDSWWWGQAHGFDEPGACVAFAGGQVRAGPLRTEVTALVARLPDGAVLRLGNPVTSPVQARVTDETWSLHGRNALWSIVIEASSPLGRACVLPVPLPSEARNVPGAIEHLAGRLAITVRRCGRVRWRGESALAALEHGGVERARAEVLRRGGGPADTDAAPVPG